MKLEIRDIKRILTRAGYFNGFIDDNLDQKALNGIKLLLERHESELVEGYASWGDYRAAVAAVQIILNAGGYSVGKVDGLYGNFTHTAFNAWNHFDTFGKEPTYPKKVEYVPDEKAFSKVPLESQCRSYYGATQKEIESELVMVDTAWPMRLDYDLKTKITRFQLHKLAAPSAALAMREIATAYGNARLRDLGLDRFAGSYVWRKKRGGKSLSMHSFGCAIDFYAGLNGNLTRCPDALFCKPEYQKFFDIWEKYGWLSLGRAIGRDWMHVQRARLK